MWWWFRIIFVYACNIYWTHTRLTLLPLCSITGLSLLIKFFLLYFYSSIRFEYFTHCFCILLLLCFLSFLAGSHSSSFKPTGARRYLLWKEQFSLWNESSSIPLQKNMGNFVLKYAHEWKSLHPFCFIRRFSLFSPPWFLLKTCLEYRNGALCDCCFLHCHLSHLAF